MIPLDPSFFGFGPALKSGLLRLLKTILAVAFGGAVTALANYAENYALGDIVKWGIVAGASGAAYGFFTFLKNWMTTYSPAFVDRITNHMGANSTVVPDVTSDAAIQV